MSARLSPAIEQHVVGLGAMTSIGQYPEAIAAAAAGGINRFRPAEALRHPRSGAPVTMALLSTVPNDLSAVERMKWLATKAASQALAPLGDAAGLRVAVLLALPSEKPGMSSADAQSMARALIGQLGVPVVRELSGVYDSGQDGGIAALERSSQVLASGQADVCLVGGVDSYRDPDMLGWLARAGRLKDDETPHGLIPGEAAAFAVLTTRQMAHRLPIKGHGRLLGVHRAPEPSPWYSGRSTQGRGLTAAISGAFAALPPQERAHQTYCDANGEPWRADEWSFAYLRTARNHSDPMDLRHPADCWGDVGAASAILLVATALTDIARGRTRGPRALVWCASDTRPYRGAVVLEADLQEGFAWA